MRPWATQSIISCLGARLAELYAKPLECRSTAELHASSTRGALLCTRSISKAACWPEPAAVQAGRAPAERCPCGPSGSAGAPTSARPPRPWPGCPLRTSPARRAPPHMPRPAMSSRIAQKQIPIDADTAWHGGLSSARRFIDTSMTSQVSAWWSAATVTSHVTLILLSSG